MIRNEILKTEDPASAFSRDQDCSLELLSADEDISLRQAEDSAVPRVRLGDVAKVHR